jgi:hypothetical protein
VGCLPRNPRPAFIYIFGKFDLKKEWQRLTYEQQKPFEEKAEYLIERGYVKDKTVEELAKEIFQKDK